MPWGDAMPSGEMPPAIPEGEMPPAIPESEMTPSQDSGSAEFENGQQTQPSDSENIKDTTTDTTNENSNRMQRGGMGGGMGGMQGNTQKTENTETASQSGILDFIKTYSTPITAVILLALAFVFVIFYKRKTY